MSDSAELTARVHDLESRIAFQDDTIEQLSEVIRTQWAAIDRLTQRLDLLESRLDDAENRLPPVPVAPPPHY